ncbi:MAG: TrkH family potassium uptake protein [Ileibacterium sp.]|nr:TrkH family potassium uptake protein [Ileibacterium sp.]
MNLGIILYVLGMVCMFEAGFLLLPLFTAFLYQEYNIVQVYGICIVICMVIGLILVMTTRKNRADMKPKEGVAIVGLSWLVLSLLGALPFFLSGEIPHYIDAFFETVSGFTTTGSTILTDVDAMSYGSRMWRSFTHWVGGMGVLVFLLALLPSKNGSFMNLMMAESPGPDVSKLVPKVRDTAKYLYWIYIGMTAIQLILLLLAGMQVFDAVTLTFGTAGTGGFAVRSSGFEDYTILQQGIIAVFMMLFGINFNFYFLLIKGKLKDAFKMEEVLTYLGIIVAVTAVIVISVYPMFNNLFYAIHHVFFTVSSLITTTGYATVDFNLWPSIALVLLVTIMFIGACAGSTGGGIKVGRINIMVKGIVKEFYTLFHPRSVKKVRMDGRPIAHDVVRSTNVFIALYLLIFVGSVILVSLNGKDLVTTFTAVAATLNNIGPGLAGVGPMSNFSELSYFSKLVLSFDMLAGRLELLPIIMLLIPSMWKVSRKPRQNLKG